MRAVIQRVDCASVDVNGTPYSQIEQGLMILLGVVEADTQEDIEWLAGKIMRMRIFDDENGVMNLDVTQIGGEVMVVSQFTLMASTRKGNRPSYINAAPEPISRPMYKKFTQHLSKIMNQEVKTGVFGSDMKIALVNNGPVTITIDSKIKE